MTKTKLLRTEKQAWSMVVEHDREILNYARFIVRRLRPSTFRTVVEDAEQQARLAAFWAALRYDSSRRTMFMTWARYYIWLHVRRGLLRTGLTGEHQFKPQMVSLDSLEYDPSPLVLEPLSPILLLERDRVVREVLDQMPKRLRIIVAHSVLKGRSYRQVGQKLGLSHEAVRRLRNRAVNAIHYRLWEKGLLDYCPPGHDIARTPASGVASVPSG